jgi:hypothetical protein
MQYELGSNPDLLSLNKSIFIMENYFNTQKSKGFPNKKTNTFGLWTWSMQHGMLGLWV